MRNAMWWLLIPGVISHAVLTFLTYEALRWWPFPEALATGDIQTLLPETEFRVIVSTFAGMGSAFSLTYWLASLAVSRYFEPSSKLYRRANERRRAARETAAGEGIVGNRWFEAQSCSGER
jgi:hypothetical protein